LHSHCRERERERERVEVESKVERRERKTQVNREQKHGRRVDGKQRRREIVHSVYIFQECHNAFSTTYARREREMDYVRDALFQCASEGFHLFLVKIGIAGRSGITVEVHQRSKTRPPGLKRRSRERERERSKIIQPSVRMHAHRGEEQTLETKCTKKEKKEKKKKKKKKKNTPEHSTAVEPQSHQSCPEL
jgi:hypothetical protein